MATACLLSVLIVSECYPALDETKIRWGPLVLGVATSVQKEQTKTQTLPNLSVRKKRRTSAISSESEKCHGNRKEFPAADQVNHQNGNSFQLLRKCHKVSNKSTASSKEKKNTTGWNKKEDKSLQ